MFEDARAPSGMDVKHLARELVLSDEANNETSSELEQIVKDYALVILSKKDCSMAYAATTLLLTIGANPLLLEVDNLDYLRYELSKIATVGDMREGLPFPLVFIGGGLIGGMEKIVTMHVSGQLVPSLIEAGALWL